MSTHVQSCGEAPKPGEPAEIVDGEVIFDPEEGWVNAGFADDGETIAAWWPHPADNQARVAVQRDVMKASINAVAVPNLAEAE